MSEVIASTYECIQKIGAGGGGTVYLARHLRLSKNVVLKADKREISTRPELLRREVDVLKNLSHPHIPQVYDFFVENETVYTVMDYIEGESLDKPLKRGEKYPQSVVIKWARQLLDALCYLHSPTHGTPPRGYVHSDIKPANLMRTPSNDICLIDFNIALALGEENVIGCSPGYASPEHYGLDFSSYVGGTVTVQGRTGTVRMKKRKARVEGKDGRNPASAEKTEIVEATEVMEEKEASQMRTIVPDIRSDIYSVGATLYHLLSGIRPARSAMEVVPLSDVELSPQIVNIIAKAMNPNPDLRYQTAEEMLYDLSHLHENDFRMRRWKRSQRIAAAAFSVVLISGAVFSFVGLKRMQTTEENLKLAEYSANALMEGNVERAVELALQAIPREKGILEPAVTPEAQMALTNALGVYDLSDGFKTLDRLALPTEPFDIVISPEGKRFAVICAYEVIVYDMEEQQRIVSLPLQQSALADAVFVGEDVLVYAGEEGVTSYDMDKQIVLWTGDVATNLTLSADGKRVAAVNRDADIATVYRTADGEKVGERSFEGQHMSVVVNDIFADPGDDIFALNRDGSLLAVSFSNGGLTIFDLEWNDGDMIIYEESDYSHFEGGFCGKYFAYTAEKSGNAEFGLIDTKEAVYLGGLESQDNFLLQAEEKGVFLANGNLLVSFDLDTLEEKELAYTDSKKIIAFSIEEKYSAVATEDGCVSFYDSGANLASTEICGERSCFVNMKGKYTIIGNRNEPSLRVMKLESREETQFLSYDARYRHDEARVSQNGQRVMLFRYRDFCIYNREGMVLARIELPDTEEIYDQQFVKEGNSSWLEVTWYDGTVRCYSAEDGALLSEEKSEAPQKDLYEEFFIDGYRIASSLHTAPEVYDCESGRQVAVLEENSYLTYVTQAGEYIITEYISAEGERYGILLDGKFQKLAYLPNLSDVAEDMLVFDYASGDLRKCHIYELRELVEMGEVYLLEKGK